MALITFENVTVEFPIYQLSARSLKRQLVRLGSRLQTTSNQRIIIRALDTLSFTIRDGDRVGILGHNGAGKSTLLRTIASIYEPMRGTVHIRGKVSPLLNLAFGMNDESTGFENIMLRGTLLGLTRAEIARKTDEIATFSGLKEYLTCPIRTYSSGMQLRLAFSVATAIEPEILLLDEIVGTGDVAFQEQAKQRIYDLIKQSHIVILSSHSKDLIQILCNKVMVLHAGKLIFFGDVQEGIQRYSSQSQEITS